MVSLENAIEILRASVWKIAETEILGLDFSLGRISAKDITAPINQPPFSRSPLDGYAVRAEDIKTASENSPVKLQVIGKIFAGESFSGTVERGQCVRIMTGAPIPDGADTVIRQENTQCEKNSVLIFEASEAYKNYCFAGEDYHAGDVLINAGQKINSAELFIIASAGISAVEVFRRPRIAVISTGDELTEPGGELKAGKIFDANRHYLTARLRELGFFVEHETHCEDDAEKTAGVLSDLSEKCDLLITTGGVSVGEKDIMHSVRKILGVPELFWRVDLKPGAPTLAFTLKNSLVVCLTGNPFGVSANFELLIRPVLEKLTGDPEANCTVKNAVLQNNSPKSKGARRFMRGFYDEKKLWLSQGSHASGNIFSLLGCNCLAEILEGETGTKGQEVRAYLF